MWKAPSIATLLCLASLACATPQIEPVGAEDSPEVQAQEQSLAQEAARIERLIERSGRLYGDEALAAYLESIARRLASVQAPTRANDVRVRVIEETSANAFALPNGALFVHTGILVRLENEAQLAAVLGHEITHYTHRHTLQQLYQAKRQRSVSRAVQVFATLLGGGELGGAAAEVWTLSATSKYSRELEIEADREALRCMAAAGYDPHEAPRVMQHLGATLKLLEVDEPDSPYSSHPRLEERTASYQALIQAEFPTQAGRREEARYLAAIRDALLDDAEANIEAERFRLARVHIDRHLTHWPRSARGHFVLGEYHARSRSSDASMDLARSEYDRAAQLDARYADPHRELGLLYRAQGRDGEAQAAFRRYLALAPSAPDRPIVEAYLRAGSAEAAKE